MGMIGEKMVLITLAKETIKTVVESKFEMIGEKGHEVIESHRKRAIAAIGLHSIGEKEAAKETKETKVKRLPEMLNLISANQDSKNREWRGQKEKEEMKEAGGVNRSVWLEAGAKNSGLDSIEGL
ncbi:MAG: hypothetical protein Q7U98_07010 [Methylicorpusculum sp.]|uniref:hypothetical protein n=1 Tax=Methylicorpusculum sp. TaxID=2713644 RepID=UPI0027233C52|nr:hypothetical protein [Methylicorpusculum sp.]MDO8938892.1 hypothetical protein [Methylicorpusculum sp.]MDO9240073.1 hypothetical protein [Methylicorpusculum sp.]MDP2204649.1 hypothetical protein [Methylicorpusculum sp.]